MDERTSLTSFLTLGALETLLNQAIELDPAARDKLAGLHGTAIRVRCERPLFSIYILLYEDGVEVHEDYEGHVDIRIRGSLGAMLQWLLAPGVEALDDERIRVTGPEERVQLLGKVVQEFNLWHAMRTWVDSHVRLDQVMSWLRREDPRWIARLEQLTEGVDTIALELGRQRLLLEDVLDEIQGFKHGLRRERQLDMLFLCSGMALLFAAVASATGQLPVLYLDLQRGPQTLVLASLGLTLIMSRILFGHRYLR